MRDKLGSALTVSRDASSVHFGLGYGEKKPVVFDLSAASLTDSPNLPSDFAPARVDGLSVTDWKNNYQPKFNGAKLSLDEYEFSRALAIRPDASGFVLVTEFAVHAPMTPRAKNAGSGQVRAVAWGVDFVGGRRNRPGRL